MTKELAFASDHAGTQLKAVLVEHARSLGFSPVDLGTNDGASVDYPDYANTLTAWVLDDTARGKQAEPALSGASCDLQQANHGGKRMGVLICGSGIGMSMAANRVGGIRAALCRSGLEAALSRKHNDANVLCLGERITGVEVAKDCLAQFLSTAFEGGRHAGRVEKMG